MTRARLGTVARAALVLAVAALPAGAQLPAIQPPAAHALPVDGGRLRAGRLTYRLTLVTDSARHPLGDVDVEVAPTAYAGVPAWLLTRTPTRPEAGPLDSLFVSRADLRPLHWASAIGLARLAAEFTADSIFGAMTSPLGKRNIVLGSRPDLLVSAVAVDAVLRALPLASGWRDSAAVLAVDPGAGTVAPAALAVEGAERVGVPAGNFDAWVVELETERGAERLWVTRAGQIVVRSEQPLPQIGGAVLERVLVTAPASGP